MTTIKTICTALLLSPFFMTAQNTEVAGISYPNEITYQQENLVLNGAGIRKKYFFKIYTAGLYLEETSKNGNSIAEDDNMKVLKIHILSGLMSRSKMVDAFREGFDKATNGNTANLKDRIDTFIGFITNEVEPGQVYDITFEPGKGSLIYLNGEEKGRIKGDDFKSALFKIWLGDEPADEKLKNALL